MEPVETLEPLPPQPTSPDAPAKDRIRWSAIVGAAASLLFLASYFVPWMIVPKEGRARIREAFAPEIEVLAKGDPELGGEYKALLDTFTVDGRVGALDLFRWARLAPRLNRRLERATSDDDSSRPYQVRRAFLCAAVVLAALPIIALVLSVHFLTHRLRRARAPVLILLVLAGACGTAVALGWYSVAEMLPLGDATADGMRMALIASVAQACSGLFGVTSRNWWRVYTGAFGTLGALAVIAWVYVTAGLRP